MKLRRLPNGIHVPDYDYARAIEDFLDTHPIKGGDVNSPASSVSRLAIPNGFDAWGYSLPNENSLTNTDTLLGTTANLRNGGYNNTNVGSGTVTIPGGGALALGPTINAALFTTTAAADAAYLASVNPDTTSIRITPPLSIFPPGTYTKHGGDGLLFQDNGDADATGFDLFFGISDNVGDPYAATFNSIGVGHQDGDANWSVMAVKNGTVTKTSTGTAFAKGTLYFYRWWFDGTTIYAAINGGSASYSTATNIPAITSGPWRALASMKGRATKTRKVVSMRHVDRWE